jgi:ABC-type dipeptide/oligopeptide/nickel transport system permease subunit
MALLRPVLAPYDPNRQPDDAIANQLRPPLSSVYVFATEGGKEMYTGAFEVAGDDLVLHRDVKRPEFDKRVPIASLGRPKKGWSLRGEKTIRLGDRDVPHREERHLFGTDESGRDLLSRVIYGSGISLWIGFVAMAIAVTIGTLVGACAGYLRGWVDAVLMRLVDVLLAFPLLLLLLLVVSIVRAPSILLVVVILGATGWMGVSRLVRAQFLALKELDFTVAARALGVPTTRVMFRHLLPNAAAPIIVNATLIVGGTILTEAALSFLGYGVLLGDDHPRRPGGSLRRLVDRDAPRPRDRLHRRLLQPPRRRPPRRPRPAPQDVNPSVRSQVRSHHFRLSPPAAVRHDVWGYRQFRAPLLPVPGGDTDK